GAFMMANDPDSILWKKHPVMAETLKVGIGVNALAAFLLLGKSISHNAPIPALQDPEVAGTVWKRAVAIADQYNQPGKFTTFAAYEWTSTPGNRNMHRNIFFRDTKKVPAVPFTAVESSDPVDLWRWMDGQRKAGNELLAISHNGNLSDGLMFPTETDFKGRPIDAAWAQHRMRNEPLSEIKQGKGQSETTPGLSPNDEFANYEVLKLLLLGQKGEPKEYGSYIRHAYRDGVAMQGARGHNPYRFGLVSGSDSHNAAAPYRQKNFFGQHGVNDATPEQRLSPVKHLNMDNRTISPAGLTAVWAEENAREPIFDGLKRKETYATSGVRIRLRFFGGWSYGEGLLKDATWVRAAYDGGVPMGGDLPPAKGKAPTFVVHAVKDPDSGNLDRIQIVKGWSKHGQSFERIYDVAWSGKRARDASGRVAAVGNTVNFETATYTNTIGAAELKAVWADPDFDPALDAFYYARVLEIPTPRWNLIQARQLKMTPPEGVAMTVQERAWSSPIWHTPAEATRKSRKPGLTVAEVKRQGGVALNDAQLKQLVVGKSVGVRNTVTGRHVELFYGADGRRLIEKVDGKAADTGEMGNVLHSFEMGAPAAYQIRDGMLVTSIGGSDFDVVVYRVGSRYLGARTNEFGHVNYEIAEMKP
ncbi:MAG: DUF3604 domain-containing protein, partial [Betaproteobacteria bacterium]|nr:DUF3604 domain-containing protein [Betaproteobacteria bacterium]